MKAKIAFLMIVFVLILSTCSAGENESLVDESIVNGVYTQVALTLSAQPPAAASTPTPTLTLMPTVTLLPITLTTATTVSYSTGNGAVGCDNSTYLSDVTIPDGTVITPDSTFTKTWSLQNTGSCEWTTSYSIAFYSGDAMSGSTTSLNASVSAGSSGDVSVALTAPITTGSYTGYWRLQNASGTSFGEAVYVQIEVSGSTSTPTVTSEEEATSTPTATSEPTSTTEPTSTPEPTATETPSS